MGRNPEHVRTGRQIWDLVDALRDIAAGTTGLKISYLRNSTVSLVHQPSGWTREWDEDSYGAWLRDGEVQAWSKGLDKLGNAVDEAIYKCSVIINSDLNVLLESFPDDEYTDLREWRIKHYGE